MKWFPWRDGGTRERAIWPAPIGRWFHRRTAAQRLAGRFLLPVLGLGAAWIFGSALLRMPWRVVEEIDVIGTRCVDESRVREAAGVSIGQSLFGVDADSVERRIKRIPWVHDVTVKRRLSGRFEIHVEERGPVGMSWDRGFVLIDGSGSTARLEGTMPPDVPLVTGLPAADSARTAAIAGAARTLSLVWEIPQLRRAVSEISFAERRRLVMVLAPRGTPVFLPREPGRDRLVAVASVVAHHPGVLIEARYLDARFGGQVAVAGRSTAS